MQTTLVPTVALTVATNGECNDTLHAELVQSIRDSVLQGAAADVQDSIQVEKGNCTNVSDWLPSFLVEHSCACRYWFTAPSLSSHALRRKPMLGQICAEGCHRCSNVTINLIENL